MPAFSLRDALPDERTKFLGARDLPDRLDQATAVSLTAVLAGFFLLPASGMHNALFYAALLPPVLLNVRREARAIAALRNPLFAACAAFILLVPLWGCASALLVPHRLARGDATDGLRHAAYLLVFVVAVASVRLRDEALFDRILTITLVAAALSAAASILVWAADGADLRIRVTGLSRTTHPIQAPAAYAVLLFLCIVRMLDAATRRRRLGHAAAAAVFAAYILLAQSRGVIVGAAVALAALGLIRGRARLISAGSAAGLALLLVGLSLLDLSELIDGLFRAMPYRPQIWMAAWEQAWQRPWLGHGLHTPFHVTIDGITFQHAHSVYLGTFFHAGALGLALYLVMLAAALRLGWRRRCETHAAAATTALVFSSVFMLSDTANVITNPREVWLYLWLPLAMLSADGSRAAAATIAEVSPPTLRRAA